MKSANKKTKLRFEVFSLEIFWTLTLTRAPSVSLPSLAQSPECVPAQPCSKPRVCPCPALLKAPSVSLLSHAEYPKSARMITHLPQNSHTPSPRWSANLPRMLIAQTLSPGQWPPSSGRSHTIPRCVTHHPQAYQPQKLRRPQKIWTTKKL